MTVLALAVAGALLWVPGALLARLHGVAAGTALVLGPALTWGVVGVGAVAVPRAGLAWDPLTALGWWLALTGATLLPAAAGRRLPTRPGRRARPARSAASPPAWDPRALLTAGAGVVAAGAVLTTAAWRAGTRPGDVDQLWDAVWHANLTQHIAATGSSDPTRAPGELVGAGWRSAHSSYPDALHAAAALVERLTGADAVLALAAVVLVVYAAVLPAGVAALVWTLTRGSGPGAALGAVLSVLSVAFPTDHWWRGVWSYGVSLAVAPLACAVVVGVLQGRAVRGRVLSRGARDRWAGAVLALLAVAGVVALQPAGAVVGGLVVTAWGVGRLGVLPRRRAVVLAVPVAAGVVALPLAVTAVARRSAALASLAAFDYRSLHGWGPALREVLGLVVPVDPGLGYPVPVQAPQSGLAAVLLVSLVLTATHRSTAWLAALWVLVVAAAAATVAPVAVPLRTLTLFFYSSPYRLVAVVAVVGAVMGGVAGARATRWPLWRPAPGNAPRRWPAALATTAVVAGLVGLAAGTVDRAAVRLRAGYADRVVGPHQRAVMAELARQPLPHGARVLNDPVDGSPWLYATTGVRPMFVHYSAGRVPRAAQVLLGSLDAVDTDARVQEDLRRLRVCYVYANATTVTARRSLARGFASLDAAASLQLVARSGPAAAYRVLVPGTPCAPRRSPHPPGAAGS